MMREVTIDTRAIEEIIQEEMQAMKIPGLAIVVVNKEKILYQKGFGFTSINPEQAKKVDTSTLFTIGSSSKSFTALAIMQLVERNKLSLDDKVVKYIPEFKIIDVESQVTILQLLNHTSGFSTYEGNKAFNWPSGGNSGEITRHFSKIHLSYLPGSVFEYSNMNYIILGGVIENISHKSYDIYLQDHIFKALDMGHSFADPYMAKRKGLTEGHQPVFGRVKQTSYSSHPDLLPAGYITTSIQDMGHYVSMYLNSGRYGEKRLLPEEKIRKMLSKSSDISPNYGMGWFDYGDLVHHGGNAENYHANMMLLPQLGLGFAILYNINDNLGGSFLKNDFGAGETRPYDRIQSRIINLLTKEDRVDPIINRNDKVHIGINCFLTFWGMIEILYNAWLFGGDKPLLIEGILLAINLLVPIWLMMVLPSRLHASWKALFRFTKGFGQSIYLFLIAPVIWTIVIIFARFFIF